MAHLHPHFVVEPRLWSECRASVLPWHFQIILAIFSIYFFASTGHHRITRVLENEKITGSEVPNGRLEAVIAIFQGSAPEEGRAKEHTEMPPPFSLILYFTELTSKGLPRPKSKQR